MQCHLFPFEVEPASPRLLKEPWQKQTKGLFEGETLDQSRVWSHRLVNSYLSHTPAGFSEVIINSSEDFFPRKFSQHQTRTESVKMHWILLSMLFSVVWAERTPRLKFVIQGMFYCMQRNKVVGTFLPCYYCNNTAVFQYAIFFIPYVEIVKWPNEWWTREFRWNPPLYGWGEIDANGWQPALLVLGLIYQSVVYASKHGLYPKQSINLRRCNNSGVQQQNIFVNWVSVIT